MDPYLESSGLWQDVHHRLIFCTSEALQPQLPPRYYALIEERIILEAPSRAYYPDVTVAREAAGRPTAGGVQAASRVGTAVAGSLEADVAIEVEDEEEIRQGYLEIREESGGRVVTVIEVISPTNKTAGSRAYQTYLRKQADVLASDANFVEIDLLRRGVHILAVPESRLERVRPFDYLICVHRPARPGTYQLYPRTVRQPLPRIGIPLRPEDGDVVLDLQAVFQRCYDSAPYARLLEYGSEPPTPLLPADAAWADALLREQGLR
jgi:hypothetical protein